MMSSAILALGLGVGGDFEELRRAGNAWRPCQKWLLAKVHPRCALAAAQRAEL